METPRVVLDTNVFVSAFIHRKKSYPIVEKWVAGSFQWLLSEEIRDEYIDVIARPQFERTEQEVRQVAAFLDQMMRLEMIEEVKPSVRLKAVEKDPDDDIFIECAVSGKADYIVSRDKHLLELERYQDIRIIPPHEFTALLA